MSLGTDNYLPWLLRRRFKGSAETTFLDFPQRLGHLLGETHSGLVVRPAVYPTYDTRGSLSNAVTNFVDWLTSETLFLESKPDVDPNTGEERPFAETGKGGGRGSVRVVLCGHSMGGLLAVDAALKIASDVTSPSDMAATIWPRLIAVLAYDSPVSRPRSRLAAISHFRATPPSQFYGVHPNVFRNQASRMISYAEHARSLGTHFAPVGAGLAALWNMRRNGQTPQNESQQQRNPTRLQQAKTSRWTSALWATGALATTAAAGSMAAYYKRDQISDAYAYMTDHFEYISNLWDDAGMRGRLDSLVSLPSILFHAYYNHLPPLSSSRDGNPNGDRRTLPRVNGTGNRTFIILPPLSAAGGLARLFSPINDSNSEDEIDAHTGMFSASKNPPGYVLLVQRSASMISLALDSSAAGRDGDQSESQWMGQEDEAPEREEGLRRGDHGLQESEREAKQRMREASQAASDLDVENSLA